MEALIRHAAPGIGRPAGQGRRSIGEQPKECQLRTIIRMLFI
jgi:hypothetical protein